MEDVIDKLFYVFLGAVLTWLAEQYRLARSEEVALVNEHIKDIEKFGEAAQAYWLKSPDTPREELEFSGKVRALHAATTLLYERITTICGSQTKDRYTELYSELFFVATGGKFESSNRQADPSRAVAASDLAARIVHLLRLERSSIISVSRLTGIMFLRSKDFWFPPKSRKPWLNS